MKEKEEERIWKKTKSMDIKFPSHNKRVTIEL